MRRRTVVPGALAEVYRQWHFAPAVIAGDMVYCSGIIGTSPDGKPPAGALAGAEATTRGDAAALGALKAVEDPEAQFATAFEALALVLTEAGAGPADIVELTTYHVEMARHMALFMAVRDRYLKEPYPAWTAIGVAELAVPGGLVELRAIACLPDARERP